MSGLEWKVTTHLQKFNMLDLKLRLVCFSCINIFVTALAVQTTNDYRITKLGACPGGPIGHEMHEGITITACVHKCEKRPWCEMVVYNRYLHLCGLTDQRLLLYGPPTLTTGSCYFVERADIKRRVRYYFLFFSLFLIHQVKKGIFLSLYLQ